MSPALSGQTRGPLIRCLLSRYLIRVAEISLILLSQLRVIAPSGTPTIFTSLNYNMIIACNRVNVCNSWIIYVKSKSFRNDFNFTDMSLLSLMFDKRVSLISIYAQVTSCLRLELVTLMQLVAHPHTTFLAPIPSYQQVSHTHINKYRESNYA